MTDRRRHVVYLTRNSEYHCRLDECVAVRSRSSGRWHRDHPAVRARLAGVIDAASNLSRSEPRTGQRLIFESDRPVITSPVTCVGRPDKSAIFSYCSLAWAGMIEPAPA
jgi:hypothetical protein